MSRLALCGKRTEVGALKYHLPTDIYVQSDRRSSHMAFFISLNAAITSTGSCFPVTFWISGSCEHIISSSDSELGQRWTGTYVNAHEYIVELQPVLSARAYTKIARRENPHLLISNGEFSLRLPILLTVCLELLDRLGLGN